VRWPASRSTTTPSAEAIHLSEITTELPNGRLRIDYLPFPTAYCDLCPKRVSQGEAPACVKHCQAEAMYHGPVTDLADVMKEKPHCVMFTPR
jgi:Fe-S-cluster-containing dehydrogenase component